MNLIDKISSHLDAKPAKPLTESHPNAGAYLAAKSAAEDVRQSTVNLQLPVMKLIALVESELNRAPVRGEYWYTDTGDLLSATDGGDYNHEGHVMETLIGMFCDEIGVENHWETDACWFRTELYDEDFGGGGVGYDRLETARDSLIKKGENAAMIKAAYNLVGGGQMDAREFAINFWGWVRFAQANVECVDLKADTLKRVFRGVRRILEEEGEELDGDTTLSVSTFRGTAYTVALSDLRVGSLGGRDRASFDNLTKAAKAQVRKLDVAAQPSFYGASMGG